MIISVLGSGSSGNCTLVATKETCILIDLGFGPKSLVRRLKQVALDSQKIDAVFLTHGHADHCRGISSRQTPELVPVYMNRGTRSEGVGLDNVCEWRKFNCRTPVLIGDIKVEAFPVSHDASDPVGFRISGDQKIGALVTDLGEITSQVKSSLEGCDWLVLESNHDENLLKIGPYPWHVKQRVLSPLGHLSNRMLAKFIRDDFDGRAEHIFLAHLSRQNNNPQIALRSARRALQDRSRKGLFEDCQVHLTFQAQPSNVVNL